MVGNILFWKTIQALKQERQGQIPWDEPLDQDLTVQWIENFEMLLKLEEIKLRQSILLAGQDAGTQPVLVKFNKRNQDSFGMVAYALWSLSDGSRSA